MSKISHDRCGACGNNPRGFGLCKVNHKQCDCCSKCRCEKTTKSIHEQIDEFEQKENELYEPKKYYKSKTTFSFLEISEMYNKK